MVRVSYTDIASPMDPLSRYIRIAPLTVAVAFGPLIDIGQFVISPAGATSSGEMSRVSQVLRGALVLLMLVTMRSVRTFVRENGLVTPLLGLAMYGLIGTALRGDAGEAVVFCTRVLFLVVIYLSAKEQAARGRVGPPWPPLIAWTVVASVVGSQIVGYALDVRSAYQGAFTFPGMSGEPSIIAASTVAVLPLFFLRTPLRTSDDVGAVLAFVSLVGTQRRSGIVAAVVGFSLIGAAALAARQKRHAFRFVTLLLVLIAATGAVARLTPLGEELVARFDDLNVASGGTASGRTEFQLIAVRRILDRDAIDTMFGEGLGALRKTLAVEFGMAIGGHNDWIDFVYAFGIPGAVFFLMFHVRLVRMARGAQQPGKGAMLMAVGIVVAMEVTTGGVLDPSFAPLFAMYGFLVGRSVALQRLSRPHIGGPRKATLIVEQRWGRRNATCPVDRRV